MSETPRTDAATFCVPDLDDLRVDEGLSEVVSAEFSSQLERDLTAAEQRVARLEDGLHDLFIETFESDSDFAKIVRIKLRALLAEGGR